MFVVLKSDIKTLELILSKLVVFVVLKSDINNRLFNSEYVVAWKSEKLVIETLDNNDDIVTLKSEVDNLLRNVLLILLIKLLLLTV